MAAPKPEQKKKSDLVTRTITGLIFGGVVAACIVWNLYSLMALMGIVMVLSLREFYTITKRHRVDSKVKGWYLPLVTLVAAGIYLAAFADSYGYLEEHGPHINLLLLVPGIFLFFFVLELFSQAKEPFRNIGHHMLAFAYLVFPFTLLAYLTHSVDGTYDWRPVLGIVFLIWANDSSAYLVGRTLGKTKLFPRISPGKTIEGSVGGVVGCAIVAIGLFYLIPVNGWEMYDWVVVAILASTFATFGDLVESMLKRNLGIKDSGTMLPGHGGILDRFDAFYFTIPLVVAYLAMRGLI
ncbi:phosphatidate cytidylyltransferase [soil metagenome]